MNVSKLEKTLGLLNHCFLLKSFYFSFVPSIAEVKKTCSLLCRCSYSLLWAAVLACLCSPWLSMETVGSVSKEHDSGNWATLSFLELDKIPWYCWPFWGLPVTLHSHTSLPDLEAFQPRVVQAWREGGKLSSLLLEESKVARQKRTC